ncbi:MAG: hypothetical protein AAF217_10810 [Pseudomonadota bacterium]
MELKVLVTAVMFTATGSLTGAEFQLPIATFFKIQDDLIVEDRTFYNAGFTVGHLSSSAYNIL